MIKILFALLLLPVLAWAVTLFPWPDAELLTWPLQVAVGNFLTFNQAFPIDFLFGLFFLALGLELALFATRAVSKTVGFVTGHRSPLDDSK